MHWAYGLLDETGFRSRALYGLYVALLAVATDASSLATFARALAIVS